MQLSSSVAASVDAAPRHAESEKSAEGISCQQGFHKLGSSISTWMSQLRMAKRRSCREVLQSWAGELQREFAEAAADEAAKELLGCDEPKVSCGKTGPCSWAMQKSLSLIAPTLSGVPPNAASVAQESRRRPLVQQGSRGAHLARLNAARRGARLSKWSHVRRQRAAHSWANDSTLGFGLSFAFSLAASVYNSIGRMVRALGDLCCAATQGVSRSKVRSTDSPAVPEAANRARLNAHAFARQVLLPTLHIHAHARTNTKYSHVA